MGDKLKRAVLLDRDGVINRNRTEYVRSWSEFEFLDGALQALARLADTDFEIVIASNQSAIGRQLVTREAVEEIHQQMAREIERWGGRVNQILYCPHPPDEDCACRKPRPGLLIQSSQALHLNLAGSYLVGDSLSDIQAGLAAGCTTLLVRTGLGNEAVKRLDELDGYRPVVVDDLAAAVEWILNRERVLTEPTPALGEGPAFASAE